MLSRLAGAWNSFSLEQNGMEYGRMLRELEAKYGRLQVDRGITTAINDGQRPEVAYHPKIAEMRYYIANATTHTAVVHKLPCATCGDSGWIAILSNGLRLPYSRVTSDDLPYKVDRCPERRIV